MAWTVTDPDTGQSWTIEDDAAGVPPETEPRSYALSEVPGAAASNIWPSAKKVATETYQAVRHPLETAKGIGGLVLGGYSKIPSRMNESVDVFAGTPIIQGTEEQEPIFDAVTSYVKDRYGSWDNVKRTAAEDPVGFLMDAATVFTAGGALGRQAPGIVGRTGAAAKTLGEAINPVNLPANVVKAPFAVAQKVAPEPMQRAASSLYEKGAKFSTAVSPQKRERVVATAVREGIRPRMSGYKAIQRSIANFENLADAKIAEHMAKGSRTAPTIEILDAMDDIAREAKTIAPTGPGKFVNAVGLKQLEVIADYGNDIPLDQLQRIKKGLNNELLEAHRKGRWVGNNLKVRKAYADAVRRVLYDKVKEIKGIHLQEGELLELRPFIMQAANRLANRNLFSLSGQTGGIAGGTMGGGLWYAVGAAATSLVNSEKFTSRLAFLLGKRKGVTGRPGSIAAGLRAAGIAAGDEEE